MFKKILFLLLFIFLPSFVYADNFFSSGGDIEKNMYVDTIMFGISEIPKVGNCPGCIEYDISKVKGSYRKDLLGSVSIEDITYPDIHYGVVRKPNLYDEVFLPPYSKVDFIYLYKNDADEIVNITKLGMFLSSRNYSRGLHMITDAIGNDGYFEAKYRQYNLGRNGILKHYSGIGLVNNDSSGAVILDTVTMNPVLTFKKWEVRFIDGDAHIKMTVANHTFELLNYVEYVHGEYFLKRDFEAYEEYTYEYVLQDRNEENIEYPSIFYNGIRSECAVNGVSVNSITFDDSVIVYGVRESGGEYLNYVSSRVKPYPSSSFCITRIPFKIYGPQLIQKHVEQDYEEEVLGIEESIEVDATHLKKLPKTGVGSGYIYLSVFLVVIAILCYYHIRRLKK